MILWLITWLKEYQWKIPTVFEYTSTRMILSAAFSLVFCILIGPFFIRKLYELKIGQKIRTEADECKVLGELHQKKQNTPTMGGLLILTSIIVSLLLFMDLKSIFTWILFFTIFCFGFLGGRDDYLKLKYRSVKGLSAKKKLLYQVGFSVLIISYFFIPQLSEGVRQLTSIDPPLIKIEQKETAAIIPTQVTLMHAIPIWEFATRLYVPFLKDPFLIAGGVGIFLMGLFWIFVIVGSSNAVNLTDGLDGLAAGCLIMVAATLSLIAFVSNNFDLARYLNIPYIEGSGEIAIFLTAFIGACLGFLWYNSHPAEVFMGDVGSLTLGGVIGVSAILLKKELLLGIVGGVFVVEAMSVILQVGSFKLRNKQRIFLCAPLHHHFEYKGWAETKVVIRFWIVALLLALIGIASLKFQ